MKDLKPIFLFGHPGPNGGAHTEMWHTLRRWREAGLEVTVIPDWALGGMCHEYSQKCEQIGCKIERPRSNEELLDVPGLAGSTVVSFCMRSFPAAAPELQRAGCRLVWVNCMCFLHGKEIEALKRGDKPYDAYVFQSEYQRDRLAKHLAEHGAKEINGHLIRGAFCPDDFTAQTKPHRAGTNFVIGRLSRADCDKFPNALWKIIETVPHNCHARVMGWGANVEKRLGAPPVWANCLPPGTEDVQTFLSSLHCLMQVKSYGEENWPRVGLEAMAVGVPLVVQNRWGWREMIEHEKSGLLTSDDLPEIAYQIARLAHDEKFRLSIIEGGHKRVKKLSDPEPFWAAWKELLQGVECRTPWRQALAKVKVVQPADILSAKQKAELGYWNRRLQIEGKLANDHYHDVYTKHFGLTDEDYRGRRVLDVGCGPRGSLGWCSEAKEAVGLDPLGWEYAGMNRDAGHQIITGKAEEIPFPDNHFDIVSCFNALDHTDDFDHALSEMKRVLKPGGLLLLLVNTNHAPTALEPHTLGPEILVDYFSTWEKVDSGHFAGHGDIYEALRQRPPYVHGQGVLMAKLRKPAKRTAPVITEDTIAANAARRIPESPCIPVRENGSDGNLPKIACICCTYARPHLLPRSVQAFLDQDYPADKCELIILDDAGQYAPGQVYSEPKPWRIVSIDKRFLTLGEKRNAAMALASPDCQAYAVWDDDDIYLPWTLKAHAAALQEAEWSNPSMVMVEQGDGLKLAPTGGNLYHAAWAFTRDAFVRAGGYPEMQSGQDQGLRDRMRAKKTTEADPLKLGFGPFFIMGWGGTKSFHLSARGAGQKPIVTYEGLADVKIERGVVIDPAWDKDWVALAKDFAASQVEEVAHV